MARNFTVVYEENAVNGSRYAERFMYAMQDKEQEKKLLKKLRRKQKNTCLCYCAGETMHMHILPDLSKESVEELSRRVIHYSYAVCKREKKNREKVLYLSMFHHEAERFKNSLPIKKIKIGNREYQNPNYYVKELRLII